MSFCNDDPESTGAMPGQVKGGEGETLPSFLQQYRKFNIAKLATMNFNC
jgi:hypothetical protein